MVIQAVDLAIKNGMDLEGTPIPPKMLNLYKKLWMRRIKDKRVV